MVPLPFMLHVLRLLDEEYRYDGDGSRYESEKEEILISEIRKEYQRQDRSHYGSGSIHRPLDTIRFAHIFRCGRISDQCVSRRVPQSFPYPFDDSEDQHHRPCLGDSEQGFGDRGKSIADQDEYFPFLEFI